MEIFIIIFFLLLFVFKIIIYMPLTLTCGMMVLFPDNKKMLLYLLSAVIYLLTFAIAVLHPAAYGFTIVLFFAWLFMVIASLGVFKVLCKTGLVRNAHFTIPLSLSLFHVTLKMFMYQALVACGSLEYEYEIARHIYFDGFFVVFVFLTMLILFVIALIGYKKNNLRFHVLLFLLLVPIGFISTRYITECFSGGWSDIVFTIILFLFFSIIPFMRYIENRTRQDEPKVMRAIKLGFIPGVIFLIGFLDIIGRLSPLSFVMR